jgi:hypothetical protein
MAQHAAMDTKIPALCRVILIVTAKRFYTGSQEVAGLAAFCWPKRGTGKSACATAAATTVGDSMRRLFSGF